MAKEVRQFDRLYGVTAEYYSKYYRGYVSSTIAAEGFEIHFSSAAAWTALFGFETAEEAEEFINSTGLNITYAGHVRVSNIRAQGKEWVKVPIYYCDVDGHNISAIAWVDNDKFTTWRSSQRFVNQAKETFPQYLDPDAPGPRGGFSLWEDFDPNAQEIVNTPECAVAPGPHTLYTIENADGSEFLSVERFGPWHTHGKFYLRRSANLRRDELAQVYFQTRLGAEESLDQFYFRAEGFRIKEVTISDPLIYGIVNHSNSRCYVKKADFEYVIRRSHPDDIEAAVQGDWWFTLKEKHRGFSSWE